MIPQLKYVNPEEIVLGDNVRSKITKESVASLSRSIREQGILPPLSVMNENDKFKLIAGFRRYAAAQLAEAKSIPVHIMEIENIEEVQLIENLQREDLNPVDEAKAYQKLLTEHTIEDMTIMVGKGKWYVKQRLSLLELAPKVRDAVSHGILSPGHGATIARLKDHKQQAELMKMVISDRMSIQQTENNLDEFMGRLEHAPFDKKGCKACTHNGAKHEDMFDADASLKGRCLDKDCYGRKLKTHLIERKAALIKKGYHVLPRDKFYAGDEHSKSKPINNYSIDEIGEESYKENCLKPCENIVIVLDRNGDESQFCLKPSCWKKQAKIKYAAGRKKQKSEQGETGEDKKPPTDDLRRAVRVDETQRRFILEKVRKLVNHRLVNAVALESVFSTESGNTETISEYLKIIGVATKKQPNYELRRGLVARLFAMDDKDIGSGLLDAAARRLETYSTEALLAIAKQLKVTMDMFKVDESYLAKWTKTGLIKLSKHLGLKPDKDLEKKPKGEIISWILKQEPDKAPKELL